MIMSASRFFVIEPGSCADPLVDIYETDASLVVEADLPGMEPDNLVIRVYEDLVILEGVRGLKDRELLCGESRYLCMERYCRSFRRIIRLPIRVNTMAGKAAYRNGVLKITFPKLEGRVIRIAVSSD